MHVLNDVLLNQVLVEFMPLDDTADGTTFTDRVVGYIKKEGTCWLGAAQWHGQCRENLYQQLVYLALRHRSFGRANYTQ